MEKKEENMGDVLKELKELEKIENTKELTESVATIGISFITIACCG